MLFSNILLALWFIALGLWLWDGLAAAKNRARDGMAAANFPAWDGTAGTIGMFRFPVESRGVNSMILYIDRLDQAWSNTFVLHGRQLLHQELICSFQIL